MNPVGKPRCARLRGARIGSALRRRRSHYLLYREWLDTSFDGTLVARASRSDGPGLKAEPRATDGSRETR